MHTTHNTRTGRSRSARRGFTLTEAAAVAGAVVVLTASGVPLFQRAGCNAMRQQSASNLKLLAAAHEAYAADFGGRQFTTVPDNLGSFATSVSDTMTTLVQRYQQQSGCIPPIVLGTSPSQTTWGYYIGCNGSQGSADNAVFYAPLNFSSANNALGVGSFRLLNSRGFNPYVGGRFYDQTFYAPDDPGMKGRVQKWINEERDFEFDGTNYVESTYDYSPAAMYHPRVFGDGTNPLSPSYLSPNSVANGQGYKSPANSQCQYPSLKTRQLERYCMEPSIGLNPAAGNQPYQWNHSYRSRSLAMFFDGSVRLFTTGEAMNSEARSRASSAPIVAPLWVRNTPFGVNGFFGQVANDPMVRTSAHYLTAGGIRGRDTLSPP